MGKFTAVRSRVIEPGKCGRLFFGLVDDEAELLIAGALPEWHGNDIAKFAEWASKQHLPDGVPA